MFYVVHCFSGELFVFFTQCLSCLVGGFTTLLDALVLTGSLLCNFFFTSYTIEKFDFSEHLILLGSLTFPATNNKWCTCVVFMPKFSRSTSYLSMWWYKMYCSTEEWSDKATKCVWWGLLKNSNKEILSSISLKKKFFNTKQC